MQIGLRVWWVVDPGHCVAVKTLVKAGAAPFQGSGAVAARQQPVNLRGCMQAHACGEGCSLRTCTAGSTLVPCAASAAAMSQHQALISSHSSLRSVLGAGGGEAEVDER